MTKQSVSANSAHTKQPPTIEEMKKYQIIYADPPWHYNDRRNTNARFSGGAMNHYPVMKVEEIKKLPVAKLADSNCMLFLWATFPNLQEALDVIRAWGFEYKTLGFSWIKTNRKNKKPFFGIGYYSKSNCEVCLIGVKGKPIVKSNGVSSVVISPRERHSKKPDIVRKRIVDLCGDIPRVELFARKPHTLIDAGYWKGWDVWGNEVDSDINLKKGQDER